MSFLITIKISMNSPIGDNNNQTMRHVGWYNHLKGIFLQHWYSPVKICPPPDMKTSSCFSVFTGSAASLCVALQKRHGEDTNRWTAAHQSPLPSSRCANGGTAVCAVSLHYDTELHKRCPATSTVLRARCLWFVARVVFVGNKDLLKSIWAS